MTILAASLFVDFVGFLVSIYVLRVLVKGRQNLLADEALTFFTVFEKSLGWTWRVVRYVLALVEAVVHVLLAALAVVLVNMPSVDRSFHGISFTYLGVVVH